jgi:hypothetical protein
MRKVIFTRILLAVHLFGVALVSYNLWKTNDQLTSPLIPESIKPIIDKPIITCIIVSSATFIISASAYYFSKNILSMCVSAITIIYICDPGLLIFLPASMQVIVS